MNAVISLKTNDTITIENIKSIKCHENNQEFTDFDNFCPYGSTFYTFIGKSSLVVFGDDISYIHFQNC